MRRSFALLLSACLTLASLPPQAVSAADKAAKGAPGAVVPVAGAVLPQVKAGQNALPGAGLPGVSVSHTAGAAPAASASAAAGEASQPAAAIVQAAEAAASIQTEEGSQAAQPESSSSPVFDGSSKIETRSPGLGSLAVKGAVNALSRSALGRFVPAKLVAKANAPQAPATAFSPDPFGGPQRESLSRKDQARQGLRWGLHLTAISTLVSAAIDAAAQFLPLHATFPYIAGKLSENPKLLELFPELKAAVMSRMELLVDWGPQKIAAALDAGAAKFLFWDLPYSTAVETLQYQGVIWGMAAALPLIRGLWGRFAAYVGGLDANTRSGLETPVKAVSFVFAQLSRVAFPVAALVSALAFGRAHLPMWGLNSEALFVPLAAGLALSYITWKSRSLLPAFVAHLTYNVLILGVLMTAVFAPAVGGAYSVILSLGSIGYLAYSFFGHLKRRAAARGQKPFWSMSAAGLRSLGLAGAALAALLMVAGPAPKTSPGSLTTSMPKPSAPITLTEAPKLEKVPTTEEVVKAVKPAVVQILIQNKDGKTVGSGSGGIITKDGIVFTNNHVVGPVGIGGTVVVRFADGRTLPAVVLAANKRTDVDLAFLKLPDNPRGYPTLSVGKAGPLSEGAKIIAMGYPFGLPFTVTTGVLSGKGGQGRQGYELQHDAAVNPGNSGGPAFNELGEVVGVNTAIYSKSGAFAGISFARSAEAMLHFLKMYEQTGSISPAWLGVIVDRSHPVPGGQGMLVESVRPGSPAAIAGLKAGDRIVRVNGRTLPPSAVAPMALSSMIVSKKLGDELVLSVDRDDETVNVKVVLGEWLAKPGKLFRPNAAKPPAKPGQPDADDDDKDDGHGH